MKLPASLIAVAVVAAVAGAVAGRFSAPGRSAADSAPVGQPPPRQPLYYRNPMGLADTSPVPKKDPMGMDYVPVYAGEEKEEAGAANVVRIAADKVQKLGVRTEAAQQRTLTRTVRAVGTLQFDERSQYTVAPKFDGWIERLHVNTTGQAVVKGQALMEVYSPELVSAQREFLIAEGGGKALANAGDDARAGFRDLSNAALQRLKNWDVSAAQIRHLAETGEVRRTLTLVAPATGVVVDKPAVAGKRFMAGEPLYQIAGLGSVWLIADVFEQDLAQLRLGQTATLKVNAYPDKSFAGKVTFIAPTLSPETRTAKVRIELPNPQGLLKPQMYGSAELGTGPGRAVLAVPESALIDSGTRQVVLVQLAAGRFESRAVRVGQRGDGFVEIIDGVRDGEAVVVRANFLIDAESNLKAALGGLSGGASAVPDAVAPAAASTAKIHSGEGRVEAVDLAQAKVTVAHGPIPSLHWPAMKMPLPVADPALLRELKPGMAIAFEVQEQDSGEFAIVRWRPATAKAADAHGNH